MLSVDTVSSVYGRPRNPKGGAVVYKVGFCNTCRDCYLSVDNVKLQHEMQCDTFLFNNMTISIYRIYVNLYANLGCS